MKIQVQLSSAASASVSRNSDTTAPRNAGAPLIYVVDDAPYLARLYTLVLEADGYAVRAFEDRAEALTALQAAAQKPELLITDYRGLSLPVEAFMRGCRAIHPPLRILMASGFCERDLRFGRTKPDRFILKPFTVEMFRREVKTVLTLADGSSDFPTRPELRLEITDGRGIHSS